MKMHAMSVVSLLLLCALILAATVIVPLVASPPITVEVRYSPSGITSQMSSFTAIITLPPDYSSVDIDPDTILLEGLLKPIYTQAWSIHILRWRFHAKFDPDAAANIAIQKLYHLITPPSGYSFLPPPISLTITGNFYDGTPFTGTGTVKVMV